jgi:nucleoid-associated protein YgaU
MAPTKTPNKPTQQGTGYQPRTAKDNLPRTDAGARRNVPMGLLAVLGTLVLLIGVPVALVMLVGNPLPTSLPSRDWLTADVTSGLVIKVLAVLVWVVWAHFVICFLTEWRAVRAGRMPSHVGFGGGSQLLARRLVAGLLLLGGTATLGQGLASANEPAPAPVAVAAQQVEAQAGQQSGQVQVPLITPQQQARVDAENAAAAATQAPQATKHYEVTPPQGRHHDTLWDIADRTLGDPFRYKEIFELNKGKLQADGRRLTDADLIRPGWQLVLPADAKGAGVTSRPVSATPPANTPGAAFTGVGGSGASAGSAQTGASGTMADTAFHTSGATASTTAQDSRTERGANLGQLLLGGGLILAGIARALTAQRGPFGEPDEDAAELESAANTRRAEFLDTALRALAQQRTAADQPMPEVLFAYVDDAQVVLHLSGSTVAPERPWTASPDGQSWTLQASDLVAANGHVPAPYPSLVNVAESHGFDVLVDLELAPGLVAVGGNVNTARETVMSMAVDLSTHAWSDDVKVVMVGFGDRLGSLVGARIKAVDTVDEALADLGATGSQASVVNDLGLGGVLAGRQRGRAADLNPVVLFLSGAPTTEQAQRIAQLTSSGRTALSVVSVGDTPSARWRFVVDEGGHFDAAVLGVSGTARRLGEGANHRIEALLAAATRQRDEGARTLESTSPRELGAVVASAQPGDAAAAPAATDLGGAPVVVRLLGDVEVSAPGRVNEARRALLTEAVVMAALHPEGLHEAVLRSGLWPRGVEDDVMDARLADAQEWLGNDAQGRARLSFGDDGRWHLSPDVAVDYRALAQAAQANGPAELDTLLAALRLGTGEAFGGAGTAYRWLTFAREARQARLLATSVARRASELAAAGGDHTRALEALRLGTTLVPTAEVLWRERLRLVAAHEPSRLADEVAQMYSVLAEHGVKHEPATDALVTELAPGLERATGS